ncbi:MAG TPA: hypothetical protein DIS77_09745 [Rothia sp.]|nr:hypothetical protein [Rothia sp. (in: high G+C Gram-positive bacteria)]
MVQCIHDNDLVLSAMSFKTQTRYGSSPQEFQSVTRPPGKKPVLGIAIHKQKCQSEQKIVERGRAISETIM